MSATSAAKNGQTYAAVLAGGFTGENTQAPVVTAGAYTSGMCIGGLLTLANALRIDGPNSGLLQSIVLLFADTQSAAVDVVLFNANPVNSTITDHTALAIAAADLAKVISIHHLTDISSLGTPTIYQALQIAKDVVSATGQNTPLYAAVVARGSMTLGSTSDMTAVFGFLQD